MGDEEAAADQGGLDNWAEYEAQEVTWDFSSRDETYQPIRYSGNLDNGFVQDWFGREITEVDLSNLAGVPPEARITVSGSGRFLAIEARGQTKIVNREGQEVLVRYESLVHVPLAAQVGGRAAQVLKFQYCTSEPVRTGYGTDAIVRMVAACERFGLEAIYGLLAGDGRDKMDDSTGYYVWPALGFDALLSTWEDLEDRPLPEQLRKTARGEEVESLQDLFDLPGGPDWWWENGSTIAGLFEIRSGSESRLQLSEAAAKLAQERRGP